MMWVAAVSHAQFGPGCAPPSVPNFNSGNQIALNVAMPQALNFGFASRPASCTPYNGVRVKAASSLPPGITEVLNVGATSVGFSGTPTALGSYTAIIEVTPDGGTTWGDALRIVFEVDACMHWNGSRNQRFPVRLPDLSSDGRPHIRMPQPRAGIAYSASRAVLANAPQQYPPNTYCAPASFQLSDFGGGTMSATSGPGAPLGFTVSGTPSSTPSPDPNGCLTSPDAGIDANIGVRNAANEQIGGLPVCFAQSDGPGPLSIGANLPVGTVGVPYSGTFTTNAITTPVFAIIDGALPPGLTLNPATGAVTGTPTTAGVTLFVARVTANDTQTASNEFSITINAAPTQGPIATSVPTLPHAALGLFALLIAGAGLIARRQSARREKS